MRITAPLPDRQRRQCRLAPVRPLFAMLHACLGAALCLALAIGTAAGRDEPAAPELRAVSLESAGGQATLSLRFSTAAGPIETRLVPLADGLALRLMDVALADALAAIRPAEGSITAVTIASPEPDVAEIRLNAATPLEAEAEALPPAASVLRFIIRPASRQSRSAHTAPLPAPRPDRGRIAPPIQRPVAPQPDAKTGEVAKGEGTAEDDVLVIAIDPGHGGHDPGAMVDGLVEKKLVLAFARRLALRIDAKPGLRAVLTREGDRFVPLGQRLRTALKADADAFLSIHADTVSAGDASGLAIYTLTPEALAPTAARLTERAPRDAVLRGIDLAGAGDDVTRLLVELAQRRSSARADLLASSILDTLAPDVALLHTQPHRRGNFRVLRSADLPAVLVELGFLSNAKDRERLSDRRWQARVADRMAAAIESWRRSLATAPPD